MGYFNEYVGCCLLFFLLEVYSHSTAKFKCRLVIAFFCVQELLDEPETHLSYQLVII